MSGYVCVDGDRVLVVTEDGKTNVLSQGSLLPVGQLESAGAPVLSVSAGEQPGVIYATADGYLWRGEYQGQTRRYSWEKLIMATF